MLRLPVLWLGKILLLLTRLRGGGGSAFPGLVAQRLYPQLLDQQVSRLRQGSVLITGTNGKTTTSKMVAELLTAGGLRVLANRSGSNMVRGLLSTVIEHTTWTGSLEFDIAVFEVDEPNMSAVVAATHPRLVVVLNLHRDQLDRYGELETTARLVGAALPDADQVLLNADDPLVAELAGSAGSGIAWFGAADTIRAELPDDAGLLVGGGTQDAAVPLDALQTGLTGCAAHGQTQTLTMQVHGERDPLGSELGMPGVYNAYNAAAAVATATLIGIDGRAAVEGLREVRPAFGRGEAVTVGQTDLLLLLVKNPSSFTQVIRTQLAHGPARPVLFAINDNFADGRDISWLWDVDFEAMAGRRDRIIVTGLRGTDLALRLKYAEIACTVQPDLADALAEIEEQTEMGETAFVVPTYTAMLDLRRLVGRATELKGMWE